MKKHTNVIAVSIAVVLSMSCPATAHAQELSRRSTDLKNLQGATRLYRYAVSGADRDRANLRIESNRQIDLLPGKTTFTDRAAPSAIR